MMTTVHPVYSTRPSALSLYLTPPLPGAVSLHVSSGVVLRSAEGHEEGGISNDEGGRIRKRPAGGAEPRATPSGRRRPRGASRCCTRRGRRGASTSWRRGPPPCPC